MHLLVVVCTLVVSGCGTYGFTGGTLPQHVETIAIPIFEDRSRSGIPNLSDSVTELLIDRFVNRTRLKLESNEATSDSILSGSVTRYRNQPAAVGGNEQANVNRVNITVTAQYLDRVKGVEMLPSRAFTAFSEYDPIADGIDGESEAAVIALEQIADDIFTASTSSW